ncbi:hypothetical protein JP0049_10290 [Helicobacter pylori]|nr:hypothetical protein JP0049_10290 [Helicobacter pylori]
MRKNPKLYGKIFSFRIEIAYAWGLFVKENELPSLLITPLQEVGLQTPKLTIFSPTQKVLIRLYHY